VLDKTRFLLDIGFSRIDVHKSLSRHLVAICNTQRTYPKPNIQPYSLLLPQSRRSILFGEPHQLFFFAASFALRKTEFGGAARTSEVSQLMASLP